MVTYESKVLSNDSNRKINSVKKLNLYFILVTTFSCLMFFFIIVQLINSAVIYSISPHDSNSGEVSGGLLIYSAVFAFLAILFFILTLVFFIANYVFIFMGINKISELYKRNQYYQKEFEKIKLFAILSIFTLGLVFPWIIVSKTKKLKNIQIY